MHISSLHSQTSGSAAGPDVSLDSSIHSLISRADLVGDLLLASPSWPPLHVPAGVPPPCPGGRGRGERLRLAVADGQASDTSAPRPQIPSLRTRPGPGRGSGPGTTSIRPRSRDAPSPRPPGRRRSPARSRWRRSRTTAPPPRATPSTSLRGRRCRDRACRSGEPVHPILAVAEHGEALPALRWDPAPFPSLRPYRAIDRAR